jgi:hypothetical protein
LEEEYTEENTEKVLRCLDLLQNIMGVTESKGIGHLKGLN